MQTKPKRGRPRNVDGPSVNHTVRLPRDLDDKVREYARQHPELSTAGVIRTALRSWFSSLGFEPANRSKTAVQER